MNAQNSLSNSKQFRTFISARNGLRFHSLHLQNAVRTMPGAYSCAIDSFIELFYHVIFPEIKNLTFSSNFVSLLRRICTQYENVTQSSSCINTSRLYLTLYVRRPLWDYIKIKCPSFRAMDCNAQYSEIFRLEVFF